MDNTIDLCESDNEGNKTGIEVITLDDSSCTTPSSVQSPFIKPTPRRTSRRIKLERQDVNEDRGNEDDDDDDIKIISVQRVSPKKAPEFIPLVRRKALMNSPFVYRRISANSRVKDDFLTGSVLTNRRKSKQKFKKKKRKTIGGKKNTNNNNNNQTPTRIAAAQKKKKAMAGQVKQILRSQEHAQNKANVLRSRTPKRTMPLEERKKAVPFQNGKPKFRVEPFFPEPTKILRDSKMSVINFSSITQTTRTFGTELSDGVKTEDEAVASGAVHKSEDEVGASTPDSTQNNCDSSGAKEPQPSSSTSCGYSQFGSNIYDPEGRQDRSKGSLRPIVIDGSNVAWAHGNNVSYSCRGIKICSDYFRQRGHSVVAFVPRFRHKFTNSQDPQILDELEKQGIVKFTPSREVAGQRISSYDDRFTVQYAAEVGGIIVSNDNFRDIFEEQPLWRDTIRNRVLQYIWISPTCIMFPPDPLGQEGPPLDEFLRF